jgi:hypothetical protein
MREQGTKQAFSKIAKRRSTIQRYSTSATQPTEPHAVSSKTMSSRRSRQRGITTTRSNDLGFSHKTQQRLQEGHDVHGRCIYEVFVRYPRQVGYEAIAYQNLSHRPDRCKIPLPVKIMAESKFKHYIHMSEGR